MGPNPIHMGSYKKRKFGHRWTEGRPREDTGKDGL